MDLVVSYYEEEEIKWLLDLIDEYKIYLYHKGSDVSEEINKLIKEQKIFYKKLKNVGGHGHSYIYHICKYYSNLGEKIFFMDSNEENIDHIIDFEKNNNQINFYNIKDEKELDKTTINFANNLFEKNSIENINYNTHIFGLKKKLIINRFESFYKLILKKLDYCENPIEVQSFYKLLDYIFNIKKKSLFDKSYLIYKASGGLCHMLGGMYHAYTIAKKTKRILFIDCEKHSAFRHRFSEFFNLKGIEWSDNYDDIPKEYTYRGYPVSEVKKRGLTRVNRAYGLFDKSVQSKKFNPDNKIEVWAGTSGNKGRWFLKGLKVNKKIMEKLEKETKINKPYIGIHFRNTDIGNKAGRFIYKIKKNKSKIKTIYLATDDANAYNIFKSNLPGYEIIQKSHPTPNVHNMHYSRKNKDENFTQIYETLRDMYFLLQSQLFMPSGNSGLSRCLLKQISHKENFFNLPSITKSI